LKLTAAGLFAFFFQQPPLMKEGYPMNLSDLILKIADGDKLNISERELLKKTLDEQDTKISLWSKNGLDTLSTKKVYADEAFFQNALMAFMVMDKQADTTIPDGTFTAINTYAAYTPVTGERVTGSNDYFELDTANGRIYIKQTGRVYGFYVFTVWGTNGTGNRSARLYQYHADGTEITYSVSFRLAAPSDGNMSFSTFTFIPWGGVRGIGDYVQLKVSQSSGGDLTLGQCALGAFVLR
jgi:hypothetical protein